MRPLPFLLVALLAAPFIVPTASAQSAFGSSTANTTALVGILYDLKQTQQRVPAAMDPKIFQTVVNEFIAHNWDEALLNRYYRAARPLYTTQIFIPLIGADTAPKAFGVEQIVKPRLWLAHYKGQVAAPAPGKWRFWGYADDVCALAVNGRTVLFASRFIGAWKTTEPSGIPAANGKLVPGEWLDLKDGEVIDLDILIGERPGGVFCGFIMIEQAGATYRMLNGAPVLPIFQLAPFNTPPPQSSKDAPVFAKDGPVWKAIP